MIKQKSRSFTTQTVAIEAEYNKAFDYISNPLKQCEWAINFMKEVRQSEAGFIALTPAGEVPFVMETDKATGVIDWVLGGEERIHTRLLRNGTGCAYQFTLFQPFDLPDAAWEQQGIPGLQEELATLKSKLEDA